MKKIILAFLVTILFSSSVFSANLVDIRVSQDTLFTNIPFEVEIWIENDVTLGGLIFQFNFGSDNELIGDIIENTDSDGCLYVKTNNSSRAYPSSEVFDLGGLQCNVSPLFGDSLTQHIDFGGSALNGGLPAGQLEHMYSIIVEFDSFGLEPGETGYIHLDTGINLTADPSLGFVSTTGGVFIAQAAWEPGGLVIPIVTREPTAGDANFDGSTNVGDIIFLVNYVFGGGPAPVHMACTDVNDDCNVNIADAVRLLYYIFHNGDPVTCSDCILWD